MRGPTLLLVASVFGAGHAATACFQCHTAQKDKGFVFSTWRP